MLVWVFLGLFMSGFLTVGRAADSAAALRMKAEQERKRTEQLRKFEQQKREIKQSQDQRRQSISTNLANGQISSSDTWKQPVFNAASAPPPEECLRAFVAAAVSASSMEQLLRFLPQGQAESLRQHQANYDPKQAAGNRASLKKLKPNITEESVTHIISSPYASSLKFHRDLAKEIGEILSVKIEGKEAHLVVATTSGATINGAYYPYSKARVEMIGEGNYWKLYTYRPSEVYYQDPPRVP